RTIPLTRYDLVGVGFDRARKQVQKRMVATVLDLEREMPNIRAFAFRNWHEVEAALKADETNTRLRTAESDAFWDWSLLEMLVQSGLRIEEASELTTSGIFLLRMSNVVSSLASSMRKPLCTSSSSSAQSQNVSTSSDHG